MKQAMIALAALAAAGGAIWGGMWLVKRGAEEVVTEHGTMYDDPGLYGASWLETECAKRVSPACVALGRRYRNGVGVPRDPVSAMGWYETACDQQPAFGCHEAGELHREGFLGPPDMAAARGYYERACSAGDERGCAARALAPAPEVASAHARAQAREEATRDAPQDPPPPSSREPTGVDDINDRMNKLLGPR